MAKRKFKMTAFARFLIIMLFAAPLAYIAASYYNGEDGVENIKSFFEGDFSSLEQEEDTYVSDQSAPAEKAQADVALDELNETLIQQERELDSMHFENGELKLEIKEQADEIETLKATIGELQARIQLMEGQQE